MAGDDLGAERDLDPADIALDHHLLVGVRRRRRVIHQPVAHQGRRGDLAWHVLAGLEGNGRQIAQGLEVGEQRRRLPTCIQGVETLQASRHQPLVQDVQVVQLRDRHEKPASCRLHQGLDLALVVALAGPAEAVAEQMVRLQMRKRPGAAGACRSPRIRATARVVLSYRIERGIPPSKAKALTWPSRKASVVSRG